MDHASWWKVLYCSCSKFEHLGDAQAPGGYRDECVKDWDYDRERVTVVESRTDPSPVYLPFDRVEY